MSNSAKANFHLAAAAFLAACGFWVMLEGARAHGFMIEFGALIAYGWSTVFRARARDESSSDD